MTGALCRSGLAGGRAKMLSHFEVIEDECIGCALCKERAPENFEIVEGRAVARVTSQPSDPEEEEACLEAAEFCPIGALSVTTPQESDEYPPEAAVAATASP